MKPRFRTSIGLFLKINKFIFVTLDTKFLWSLELQPGCFSKSTSSYESNRKFSPALAHTYWRQWMEFACSLLPTTSMCGRPISYKFYCNVQSLKFLNIGVSCAFMLVVFLCKKRNWHLFPSPCSTRLLVLTCYHHPLLLLLPVHGIGLLLFRILLPLHRLWYLVTHIVCKGFKLHA